MPGARCCQFVLCFPLLQRQVNIAPWICLIKALNQHAATQRIYSSLVDASLMLQAAEQTPLYGRIDDQSRAASRPELRADGSDR